MVVSEQFAIRGSLYAGREWGQRQHMAVNTAIGSRNVSKYSGQSEAV